MGQVIWGNYYVQAQDLGVPGGVATTFKISSLSVFVGALLQTLFIVSGILFIFFFFYSLVAAATSGDKGGFQSAAGRASSALVGLAIVALAYAIVRLLEVFFGIQIVGNVPLPLPY
jgi:hypothetical protein